MGQRTVVIGPGKVLWATADDLPSGVSFHRLSTALLILPCNALSLSFNRICFFCDNSNQVTALHADGTFDVVFEDKSRDEHLPRRVLRLQDIFWPKQLVEVLTQQFWCHVQIWDQVPTAAW